MLNLRIRWGAVVIIAIMTAAAGTAEPGPLARHRTDAPTQDPSSHPPIYLPWTARRNGEEAFVASRIGGSTRALATDGAFVFAGIDDRIVTYVVDNAGRPSVVAMTPSLRAPVEALAIEDGVLAAVAGVAGVHTYDIADDGGLAPRAFVGTPVAALNIAIRDGYGYVVLGAADGATAIDGRVGVVDLRVGVRGRWLGRVDVGGEARAAVVDGGFLHVGKKNGLVSTFSLADPAHPQLRFMPVGTQSPLAGELADLAMHRDILFAAIRGPAGGVVAWRVVDGNPQPRPASAATAGFVAVAADGDRVFAVAENGTVARFNLTPPLDLVADGTAPTPGARAIAAAGGRVFVGGLNDNVLVLAGATLAGIGRAAPPSFIMAAGPTGVGQVVAALTDTPPGLVAIWTGPNGRLDPAGTLPLSFQAIGDIRMRAARGRSETYAYLLYYNALEAIDLSAPGKPEKRRTLAVPDATVLAIDGRRIFVAGDGLRVIDIDTPDDPRQVAYVFRGGRGEAVAADGVRAYVAQRLPTGARPTDLWVFDVSNPAAPRQIGTLGDVKHTVDLAALGGYVYQVFDSDRRYGLQVYDARDGSAVRRVDGAGTYATDGYARGVVRDGARLYLIEESHFDRVSRTTRGRTGVHVIDISRPESPTLKQFLPYPLPVMGVDAYDGKLYVARGGMGLDVVDVGP